jgi:Na+/H+ antiporter NhaD/arsenite permease-like protein
MKWLILGLAALMYGLVIAFPKKKAWFALGAALVLLGLGSVPGLEGLPTWGEALGTYVNWKVLLIYLGCLVLAELFVYSRVPAVLADRAVERAPSLGLAIAAILAMTGILSIFVENVATVLVMAPIALEISRRLGIHPGPFMIGLAVMANLQGTATLVGDPPSMIFASFAGYSFNDFFFYAGRPSIFFAVQAGALAGLAYFLLRFRGLPKSRVSLPDERVRSALPTALIIAMIAGLALISIISGHGLHLSSGLLCTGLALLGLAWFRFIRREPAKAAWKLLRDLDWDTILFLISVFILVGAIEKAGLIADLAGLMGRAVGGRPFLGFVAILGVSMLISGFVDNVPYIMAMLPVAQALSEGMRVRPEYFMFALLVGSCLGGNLTPFGASANVVAIGILKKEGRSASFADWLRIGLPFTLLTTTASAFFIFLVWR